MNEVLMYDLKTYNLTWRVENGFDRRTKPSWVMFM